MRRFIATAIASLVLLALIAGLPARAAQPLRLALQWQPQSQFAGYYMAVKQGYYREAGLDVTLLHAGMARSTKAMLADGSAEAGTMMLADAIASGLPVVQLSQTFQRSHLLLVAWKDMGIRAPADLDGRPVSLWQNSFSLTFDAFLLKYGVVPERIPQYGSIQLFLRRGVAATAAMEYNEINRIYLSGIDMDRLTVFRMRDHGLGLPEDGLYARRDWVRRHPGQARALAQATLKGWDYARQHPEETIDTVLEEARRAGIITNRAHERWMLKTVLASVHVEGTPAAAAGRLEPETYARAVRILREAGLIDRALPFADFRLAEGAAP